jgi:hypothetical protein
MATTIVSLLANSPSQYGTCCGEHQSDSKVSLASMAWLHEIQRALQEIAVNRDGYWHLKEEIPSQVPVRQIEHSSEPAKQAPSEGRNGKAKLDSQICEELRSIFE